MTMFQRHCMKTQGNDGRLYITIGKTRSHTFNNSEVNVKRAYGDH